MNKASKTITDEATANLKSLANYWRKSSFHDQLIESLTPANRRLLITLDEMILVLTGVTSFIANLEELPSSWLYESMTPTAKGISLKVECEAGEFTAIFANLRLIRRSDMAILIPPVD